jgi:acetoin utilization protein AcuB
MLVKEWMNTDVVTVNEETTMVRATVIMKENHIRGLPVVDETDSLVGIVTDRDIKDASPSKATSLDIHEVNYLVSTIQVKHIMSSHLVYVKPHETVEFAAVLMLENKISTLPVVDDAYVLEGIITQTDIFRALVDITGIYTGGVQFAFSLEDRPGSIKEVADDIRSFGARIVSILSNRSSAQRGRHNVFIRVNAVSEEQTRQLMERLKKRFVVRYSARDYLEDLDKRHLRKLAA